MDMGIADMKEVGTCSEIGVTIINQGGNAADGEDSSQSQD